jgi:hypothetical protein
MKQTTCPNGYQSVAATASPFLLFSIALFAGCSDNHHPDDKVAPTRSDKSTDSPKPSTDKTTITQDDLNYVVPSEYISDDDTIRLEQQLAEQPQLIKPRVDLIYHYQSILDDKNKARHLHWLIKHRPRAKVLGMHVSRIAYAVNDNKWLTAHRLWDINIEKNPKDAAILGHAGFFYANGFTTDEAILLLERAVLLSVDKEKGPRLLILANTYSDWALRTPSESETEKQANKALATFTEALKYTKQVQVRLETLIHATVIADLQTDTATLRQWAKQLLAESESTTDKQLRARSASYAHVGLGIAAMGLPPKPTPQRIKTACDHLDLSGKAFSQLNQAGEQIHSGYVDLTLAKLLLKQGEQKAVLNFFATINPTIVDQPFTPWIKLLKEGQSPDLDKGLR